MFVCAYVVGRENSLARSRYDSCASSCVSTASSTRSVRSASPQRLRRSETVSRYHPSSSVTTSPYEYDIAATSSESVARLVTRNAEITDSVASDGEVSSCRFGGRGGVSRFLADRRRDSIDSGLTLDSMAFHADFRRASDPLLNNCGALETPSASQRCQSAASAPGSAAQWHGRCVSRSVGSSHGCAASLMSSRSSIATNQSDDVVDVKYSQLPSVADQVVGDLIIPDEMRDFINKTYGSQTAQSNLNADSTVADSPAAPVDSTSGLDKSSETKPSPALTSCMFEGQAGTSTTLTLGNTAQPQNSSQPQQVVRAVGHVQNAAATLPVSDAPPRSFDVPAVGSSASYFRSPGVPPAYQNSHEVQVSQVSQSWQTESTGGPRIYGSVYRTSGGGTLDLGAEDPAVRHRRNPHQMNWWARMYGYQHGVPRGYRLNYALPTASVHPPRTAASFIPSQMSPTCNQVWYRLLI